MIINWLTYHYTLLLYFICVNNKEEIIFHLFSIDYKNEGNSKVQNDKGKTQVICLSIINKRIIRPISQNVITNNNKSPLAKTLKADLCVCIYIYVYTFCISKKSSCRHWEREREHVNRVKVLKREEANFRRSCHHRRRQHCGGVCVSPGP